MRIFIYSVTVMGLLFIGINFAVSLQTQDPTHQKPIFPVSGAGEKVAQEHNVLVVQNNDESDQRRCGRRDNPPLSS